MFACIIWLCDSYAGGPILTVTGISSGLLYASCLLFMLPLGSGLNSLAAGFMQQLQRFKQKLGQQPDSSSSSSGGYGSSVSSGYGSAAAAAAADSGEGSSVKAKWGLPR